MKRIVVAAGFVALMIGAGAQSRTHLADGEAQAAQHEHHDAAGAEAQPDVQHGAAEAMAGGHDHHGGPHMKMTKKRPLAADDQRRANELLARLTGALVRYKDYRVAVEDGYRPFLAQLPLPEHHFTSLKYGVFEALAFDPARPTSLLYEKSGTGYELRGAMYTAPRHFSEDQLHQRVPLSLATWHAHVNLCMPPTDAQKPDWRRFGFRGSIASEQACQGAGGRWFPQLFGWMVHVYPFETAPENIWGHRN